MVSSQQYEEINAIFERMDKVLPGNDVHTTKRGSSEWAWHKMVIEAKHIRLTELSLKSHDWRLSKEVPASYQRSMTRRRFISESTQQTTELVKKEEPEARERTKLPDGLSLWHASDNTRRLKVLAMHDAKMFFDEQLKKQTVPATNEWSTDGLYTLFRIPGEAQLNLSDSLSLIHQQAPYLTRLIDEYAKSLCWMFNMDPDLFGSVCRVHVMWFPPGGGCPMRLLECSGHRLENGPVIHVGMGRQIITHDLAPAISDPSEGTGTPIRLAVSEGVMVILDGATRMCYSHGYPKRTGGSERNNWFSIVFFLDCTNKSVAVGYEGNTRVVIMQTPIDKERIIPVNAHQDLPPAGVKANLISSLINRMHVRLRIAESFNLSHRS